MQQLQIRPRATTVQQAGERLQDGRRPARNRRHKKTTPQHGGQNNRDAPISPWEKKKDRMTTASQGEDAVISLLILAYGRNGGDPDEGRQKR